MVRERWRDGREDVSEKEVVDEGVVGRTRAAIVGRGGRGSGEGVLSSVMDIDAKRSV